MVQVTLWQPGYSTTRGHPQQSKLNKNVWILELHPRPRWSSLCIRHASGVRERHSLEDEVVVVLVGDATVKSVEVLGVVVSLDVVVVFHDLAAVVHSLVVVVVMAEAALTGVVRVPVLRRCITSHAKR